MHVFLLLVLFLLEGCATKYILPGSRFITPESQGGVFRGQVELQQTSAPQLVAMVDDGTVDNGVESQIVNRTGFLVSTSLLEQIDLIWSHTGGGNSLLGAKFQVLGASRSAKGTGEKLAFSAAFGGNEHDVEGQTGVEFNLTGQEFMAMYGYRFSELFLIYSSFSYGKYIFDGKLSSSDPVLNGLRPRYETRSYGLNGGVEVDFSALFLKLELGYQRLTTTDTKEVANFLYGYSIGYAW
jgi:hypothetical protein